MSGRYPTNKLPNHYYFKITPEFITFIKKTASGKVKKEFNLSKLTITENQQTKPTSFINEIANDFKILEQDLEAHKAFVYKEQKI